MTSIRVRYYEEAKDVLGEFSKVCVVGSHYNKYISCSARVKCWKSRRILRPAARKEAYQRPRSRSFNVELPEDGINVLEKASDGSGSVCIVIAASKVD